MVNNNDDEDDDDDDDEEANEAVKKDSKETENEETSKAIGLMDCLFKCKECFMKFSTKELLEEHVVKHTGNFSNPDIFSNLTIGNYLMFVYLFRRPAIPL
jgi:hypothetical protein